MPYTAEHPPTPSSDELRARIPGWGADLDPADRPSVPRLKLDPAATGAHWHFPERQPEKWPRERSIEHEFLTPVFGTSTSGCRGGRRPAPARSRRGSARTARSPPRSAPPTGRRRRGRGGRPRVSGWSAPSTSSLSVATRSPRSMALVRSAARSCRRQGYPRATGAALLLSIETTANVRTRVIQGGVFVQL